MELYFDSRYWGKGIFFLTSYVFEDIAAGLPKSDPELRKSWMRKSKRTLKWPPVLREAELCLP